jgi:hypothetical protein
MGESFDPIALSVATVEFDNSSRILPRRAALLLNGMALPRLKTEGASGKWRPKLYENDCRLEGDFRFADLRTMLAAARVVRAKYPELRLVVTVPAGSSEEDRNWLRQIATRLPPGSM